MKIPREIVKDVLVQVDKFYFPVNFVVLDTQPVVNQGTQFPVILGKYEDGCEVNMIESVVQNYVDYASYDHPLKSYLVIPSCVEEVTTSELEFLHSIIEHSEEMEANGWAPRFEKFPPIEDKVLPSEEKPPKLELKPLPSHLKFAFLGVEETFPVIITFSLESD